jgi:hypothetical protein
MDPSLSVRIPCYDDNNGSVFKKIIVSFKSVSAATIVLTLLLFSP